MAEGERDSSCDRDGYRVWYPDGIGELVFEINPVLREYARTSAYWATNNRMIRGNPYGFIDHNNPHRHRPFLMAPLICDAREKGTKKSRQCGASENSVTESLALLDKYRINIVYTFPSPKQVEDFSNTRVKTALDDAPRIKAKIPKDAVKNVGLRQIGKGFLFLRSAANPKLGEGIDADVVFFDEIDRMRSGVKAAFEESLSSSKYGLIREVSTPTLPGRGIDLLWQKSTQHEWHVRCEACGELQPLRFPDNILEINPVPIHERIVPSGSYAYGCAKCKSPKLDRWNGVYVPAYPDREVVAFHVNQLACVWITADKIMEKFRRYRFPQLFWNYVLGECYAEGSQLLTEAMVEACFSTGLRWHGRRTPGYSFTVCAADWGALNWGMVIGIKGDLTMNIIGACCIPDTKEPLGSAKEMANFFRPFNPDLVIADWGFGKDRVTYLLEQFPRITYGCYYQEDSKMVLPVFSDSASKVSVDRTASLKTMANKVRSGKISMPDYTVSDLIRTIVKHLSSLFVLLEEEDSEGGDSEGGGDIVERVDHVGDDHFAHCLNYALLGAEKLAGGGVGGFAFDFV